MINTEIDSYVVMAPGGNYHDWASLSNLVKSNQYAIIKFSQFNKWYGEARFTNSNNKEEQQKSIFYNDSKYR